MKTIIYKFHRGDWNEWIKQVYNLYILENIIYGIHSGNARYDTPFWWENIVDDYIDLIINYPMRCEYGNDFPWEDDPEAYDYVRTCICEEFSDLTKNKISYESFKDFDTMSNNLYNSVLTSYEEYLESSYKGE